MATKFKSGVFLFSLMLLSQPLLAAPRQLSDASKGSEALSLGVAVVALGTMSALEGSGRIIVDSIEASAETTTLVLKRVADGASQASTVTLKLSGKALEKTALVVGAGLEISVVSTGYILISAGKALAFIPNQLGQGLLHHEKLN